MSCRVLAAEKQRWGLDRRERCDRSRYCIAGLADGAFTVALVPHTLEATTLGALDPGNEVNLEVDVLAKYVERALQARET